MLKCALAGVGLVTIVVGSFVTGVVATVYILGKDPTAGHDIVNRMDEAIHGTEEA